MSELKEVILRLERIEKSIEELKAMLERNAGYSPEEALRLVIEDTLKKALPDWLKHPIPLEALEKRLAKYLIYEEDVRGAIKHLVKAGIIKVTESVLYDREGRKHIIKEVKLPWELLKDGYNPETIKQLVQDFYDNYHVLYGRELKAGSVLTKEEYEAVISRIFTTRLMWVFDPYVPLLREKVREKMISRDAMALGNLLTRIGVLAPVQAGGEVQFRVLVDRNAAIMNAGLLLL